MMKPRNGFESKPHNTWYDIREDWDLIEASFASQYGIRIRYQTDMPWTEFCVLVSGLMHDTPLGQVVAIRAETDEDMIKSFSPDQKRIRDEWRDRQAEKQLEDPEQLDKDMEQLGKMFANMFGTGVKK